MQSDEIGIQGGVVNDHSQLCASHAGYQCDCSPVQSGSVSYGSDELSTLRTQLTAAEWETEFLKQVGADRVKKVIAIALTECSELRSRANRAEAKVAELEARCAAQEKR